MKRILITGVIAALALNTSSFAFSDIEENFWAKDKIEVMQEKGIISGFPDGTFRANDAVTREQAASIMLNYFNVPLKDSIKIFEDVPSGYWSENANMLISQFMSYDEIEGKFYFRPSDSAKRIEIAEAIVKILGCDDEEVNEELIEKFLDKDEFSESDKKYISIVAENGIMVGDDHSNFRPNDTITRAEFCALMFNIDGKKKELDEKKDNKVLVKVNNEEVLAGEFNTYFNIQKIMYENMFGGEHVWQAEIGNASFYTTLKNAVLNMVIMDKVKTQKANELNFKLDEKEIKELDTELESEEVKEMCEFYGITLEDYKEMVVTDMLLEAFSHELYEKAEEKIDLEEKVERTYYDARHILLSIENKTEVEVEEIRNTANSILKQIKDGEDFAKLAKEFSEDPGSIENGGLYENVGVGEFVEEFEKAALSLKIGEVYPTIVETDYGFHIIKLEGKSIKKEARTEEEKHEIIHNYFEELAKEWKAEASVIINETLYKAL